MRAVLSRPHFHSIHVTRRNAQQRYKMIDGLSIELKGIPADRLFNNPNLVFSQAMNPQTGELIADRYGVYTSTAKLENLDITIKTYNHRKPFITIKGSLHKYGKGNNYTDFDFTELQTTIRRLSDILQVTPESMVLHQIEFGVNITPPLPTIPFIDQIMSHKGIEYKLDHHKQTGYEKRFSRSHFEIKIYDKGLKEKLPDDHLRIEINATKMAFLQTKGIFLTTIADLLNMEFLKSLKVILLTKISELIFTDDRINPKDITNKKERAIFKERSNPRFWNIKMKRNHNRMAKSRFLSEFDSIRRKYAPDDLKENFKNLVAEKWDLLSQNVTFLPITQNAEMLRFNPKVISNNVTPTNQRFCLKCRRDISNQKTGSQYCSEKIHGKGAKSCRNAVSNLKVHEKRFYPGATLFDIDSMLPADALRIKKIAFKHS